MGNNQSSINDDEKCCRVLCWGTPPAAKDDGEWFGELPRDKKRRKSKRSRSQKNLDKMPMVPEERDVCTNTVASNIEDPITTSLLMSSPSTPEASVTLDDDTAESSEDDSALLRRSSLPEEMELLNEVEKRQPKVKLTFVNGQFVDLSTKEGQEIVEAVSSSSVEGDGEDKRSTIGGILTSIPSGHCGILGPSAHPSSSSVSISPGADSSNNDSPSSDDISERKTLTKSVLGIGKMKSGMSFGRAKSDGSAASAASFDSYSTQESGLTTLSSASDGKDAVSSIVALGDGYFLTASKCDRVIKMWKLTKASDGNTTLEFIRDFVGHSTAITCLVKVDDKGRFLSASKDREIKLWDSRFNCNDSADDGIEHRVLLATYDHIDRRRVHDIAIVDDGSYVRPTDKVDMAMAVAMTKKAMKKGSVAVSKAAKERHIIGCTCEFAVISGRHSVVKMWSIKQIDPDDDKVPESPSCNVAEVKMTQELSHEAVVESITSVPKKKIMLTGGRMGAIKLWTSAKNVFLPGTGRVWTCARTFCWKNKPVLCSVTENMQFAITSLAVLQDNKMFVSGSKSGNLRAWNLDGSKTMGETIRKEEICIKGAHNMRITSIQPGPQVGNSLSFTSASEDGKVLSFALPAAKSDKCNPCCFNAVNHGITNRYFPHADPICVTALACLCLSTPSNVIITGTTSSNGSINVLKPTCPPKFDKKSDALVLHRQAIEEETLTIYEIADKMSNGGVECKTRKKNMKTYKNCFVGSEAVTYLVDQQYAVSREDAVSLGHVLATHLRLYEHVTKKNKNLEDSNSYYRFSSEFVKGNLPVDRSKTNKNDKLKKYKTEPNLDESN